MSTSPQHPKRILVLSTFSAFGGATKSLIEVLNGVDLDRFKIQVVVHSKCGDEVGFPESVELLKSGNLSQWDNTRFGHYRGLRWLILMREIVRLPATVLTLRRIAAKGRVDAIHANELPFLPSAILAKRIFDAPLIIHVRSVQAAQATPRRTRIITGLLRRYADAIVAIDEAVSRSLAPDLETEIIYNSLRVPDAIPEKQADDSPITVGVIGALTPSKGVLEVVEACAILKDRGIPVKLLIAGENLRSLKGPVGYILKRLNFSRDFENEIRTLIAEHGLEDSVTLLGHVRDIGSVYGQLDAVCFASWLDAPGRPVFEAALHGLPVVVAMRNPTKDVVIPDVNGLCIERPEPDLIAGALERLHSDRHSMRQMGHVAREHAVARFDRRIAGRKLMALYERVSSSPYKSAKRSKA